MSDDQLGTIDIAEEVKTEHVFCVMSLMVDLEEFVFRSM